MRCATADGRANHSVDTARPLDLPDADLLIDPYVLGVWLGDGHSASARFTSADPEIAMRIEGRGLDVVVSDAPSTTRGAARLYTLHLPNEAPVEQVLHELGVLGDKHIPTAYLRASEAQRRELLAGLLDTDGTVNPTGSPQLTFTNARLAADVRELVQE